MTENGDVTVDAGYDALGTVTVNVSGSSGDEYKKYYACLAWQYGEEDGYPAWWKPDPDTNEFLLVLTDVRPDAPDTPGQEQHLPTEYLVAQGSTFTRYTAQQFNVTETQYDSGETYLLFKYNIDGTDYNYCMSYSCGESDVDYYGGEVYVKSSQIHDYNS